MNAGELQEYFYRQLSSGECYLIVSKGRAKNKMSRGFFRMKDRLYDSHKLVFVSRNGNRFLFSDSKIGAEIIVERGELMKLHFHVDYPYNRFTIRLKTFEGEHITGCGEQYTYVDLAGQKVPIWVSEHQQVWKIAKKMIRWKLKGPDPDHLGKYKDHQTYVSVPSYVSSKNYAFYCHEDSYGIITFKKGEVLIHFRQFPKSISLLTADSQEELAQKLCFLTGISYKIPDWVNDGAISAVQGGTEMLRKKYEEAKKAGIRVVALWAQDWCGHVVTSFGYQVYWNWKVDPKLYAGLGEFIRELNKDGVRFLGYINTFVKENSEQYVYAKKNDFLVKRKNGKPYLVKSTTFNAGIVDLTNPSAYNWYKEIIKKNMIGIGLSGWMADFGEYLPTDARVYGGDAEQLHNRWPTLWAQCCRDAVDESGKEDEIFFFNRAGYGHTFRFTNSMWNGDQHVDWSDDYGMGSVIPASLSLGCSSCGIVHSDIGGYTTILMMKRSSELLRRWSEMNIFSPVYRTHEGNRPKDNAQFDDPDVIGEFARNSQIFAALKPYRIASEEEYYENGTPLMRPLFFEYPLVDEKVQRREYLFGRDVLVCPVVRPSAREWEVTFPGEGYVQMFTNKKVPKGKQTVEAPLGLPIAFYKENSPFAPLFESLAVYFMDFNKAESISNKEEK